MKEMTTVGLDLARNVFQVHAVDAVGAVVIRRQVRRAQVLLFFSRLSPCLIGMEACAGAHSWARELARSGHEVRLIPPSCVKPFVKRGKTDAADAEAICTAVTRPTIRFVPVKTGLRQAMLMSHRARDFLVRQLTRLANAIRAHLGEFGLVVAKGVHNMGRLVKEADDADLRRAAEENETARRLQTMPGIGPITASVLGASLPDASAFRSARDLSTWPGLTPRPHSSGGKERLGAVSKMGNQDIRRRLYPGAMGVISSRKRSHPGDDWLSGLIRAYDFEARPGTHWMHSLVPVQEMQLLAAPLMVRSAEDLKADRQEVVMFLHDFSFKAPEEVLAEIGAGHGGGHGAGHGAPAAQSMPMGGMGGMQGMNHGAMGHGAMGGMPMRNMPGIGGMMGMGGQMAGMAMDLNDYDWDAYLANDQTLSDPEVVQVERGGRIRLRVINAAAATVFWIDTGGAEARLVAADGHAVQPIAGSRFGLAMGQRLDIEIDLPSEGGAWPILALREGARERTGLILATQGAEVRRLDAMAETVAPAFDMDLAQEASLIALDALPDRPVDRSHMLMLGGSMQPYVWTINGAVWGQHQPIIARSGERVVLSFHNMSMMAHPMHLHGHVFQVVGINGRRVAGALRDTVHVPPMSMVDVALDAGEAARWMLHCHHMPHLATGMMTEFAVMASA